MYVRIAMKNHVLVIVKEMENELDMTDEAKDERKSIHQNKQVKLINSY